MCGRIRNLLARSWVDADADATKLGLRVVTDANGRTTTRPSKVVNRCRRNQVRPTCSYRCERSDDDASF